MKPPRQVFRHFCSHWELMFFVCVFAAPGLCQQPLNEHVARLAPGVTAAPQDDAPFTLDLRQPMRLGAQAIVRRLDGARGYRPWFLLKGEWGIPVSAEHSNWDLADMTGRYLESLIQA